MPHLVQRPSEQLPLFWRADPAGRWTWSCDSWTAFTGLSEAASRGDGWLQAVHPADRPVAAARWVVAPDESLQRVPFRLKCAADDEAYREVLPRAAHALDPDGVLREWIGTLVVGTPTGAPRWIDDVQHHMRNALAVIRSVARRTARTSDTVEHYAAHFEGRLDAFARVQDALIRSPDGGVDLESLIGEELVAHRVGDADFSVEGPHLRLKGRAADAFVFALHELVINAVKFGALTTRRGTVSIAWTIDRAAVPPVLHFEWRETGVRVAGPAPRRRGFGTEVIERSLPYELNATTRLDFLPGAVHCTIALPLTDGIAFADSS